MTDNGAFVPIDELPDIPDSWKWNRLGDLVDQSRGICYGIVQPGTHDESGVPMVNSQDVLDGTVASRIEFRVAPELHGRFKRSTIRGGEILLTLVGANFGRVAIAPNAFAGFNCSRAVGIIPVREHVQFVMFCLRSPLTRRFMDNWANTTAQPTFNLKDVSNLPIPLPPVAEQKAIAKILGVLDDKIELNRRMNETLEGLARAIFQSWFVDFDPVRAQRDGLPPPALSPTTAALFPNSFEDSELGKIPKGWSIDTIKNRASNVQYGYTQSASLEPVGPRFLRITDIRGGQVDWSAVPFCKTNDDELEKYRIKDGDIFVARTGASTGDNIYVVDPPDAVFASYLVRFQFSSAGIGRFVGEFMRTPDYFSHVAGSIGGSAQPNASAQTLADATVVFPTTDVADDFFKTVRPLDLKRNANSKESEKLAAIRDALLPKLLSGEIRVAEAERLVEDAG